MNKPYVIEVKHDVKNPKPDRRTKDWDLQPVIPAGTRFLVRASHSDFADREVQELRLSYHPDRKVSPHDRTYTYTHGPLGALIVANSEKVEPNSVKELGEVHGCAWGGDEILRILVKLGRVNAADFAAVAAVPEDF